MMAVFLNAAHTVGICMDLAVKTAYGETLLSINKCVQPYYLRPKSLVCPSTPDDFWYKLPCGRCSSKIPEDQKPCTALLPHSLFSFGNMIWSRRYVCAGCAAPRPLRRILDTSWYKKRERSAQALLLLQAAGLPYDLAWPVTALAYWIL